MPDFLASACHTLCLALNDVFETCAAFAKEVDALRCISKLFNQFGKVSLKCPSHISTRWTYDFDIVWFISQNKQVVKDILAKIPEAQFKEQKTAKGRCEAFVERAEFMAKILMPLRYAVSYLEKDSSHYGCIEGMLDRVIKTLRKYDGAVPRGEYPDFAVKIAEAIEDRLASTLDGHFVAMSGLLTQGGRARIRERLSGDNSTVRDFSDGVQRSKSWLVFERKYKSFLSEGSEFVAEGPGSSTVESVVIEGGIVAEEDGFAYLMEDPLHDLPQPASDRRSVQNHGEFVNALNALVDVATQIGGFDVEGLSRQFRHWIYDQLPVAYKSIRTADFWTDLLHDPAFQDLARSGPRIARIILTAPASEAVCERNFSLRKRDVSRTSERSGEDLLDARSHVKF